MNFEKIWSKYRDGIKTLLHSKVSNPADVDDLLQDIQLKTYQNLHALKSQDSVKSWIFQISNHTIIDYYRKRAKPQYETIIENLHCTEKDTNIQQNLSQCIRPLIKALPQKAQALLMTIDLQSLSQREYAKKFDLKYSTLKSRVQKSRLQLRSLLEDCCNLSFDRRGSLIDCEEKSNNCKKC